MVNKYTRWCYKCDKPYRRRFTHRPSCPICKQHTFLPTLHFIMHCIDFLKEEVSKSDQRDAH